MKVKEIDKERGLRRGFSDSCTLVQLVTICNRLSWWRNVTDCGFNCTIFPYS